MKRKIIIHRYYLLVFIGLLLLCRAGLTKDEAGDTASVTIESFQFQPQKITVKKGGSVTFTNHDAAPHTVSPANGAAFSGTGRLLKGDSKAVQFNEVGTQQYACDFHPSMKGTVVVVDK